jgi:hypothetical protein
MFMLVGVCKAQNPVEPDGALVFSGI